MEWLSFGSGGSGVLAQGDDNDYYTPKLLVAEWKHCNIEELHIGGIHALGINNNGGVYSWGGNCHQQLAIEVDSMLTLPLPIDLPVFVVHVSCGWWHSIAVTREGDVFSWGWNAHGQLGLGHKNEVVAPQRIESISHVSQVSCGWKHTVILTKEHQIFSCGSNRQGQLGLDVDESSEPQIIGSLQNIEQVSCGWEFTLCRTESGELWSWGSNRHGQAGKPNSQRKILYPTNISTNEPITMIATGWSHCLALTDSGKLFSWGRGDKGQLGLQTRESFHEPQIISLFSPEFSITKIGCGSEHSFAIDSLHRLWTWGWGEHGNLGHGNTLDLDVPAIVYDGDKPIECNNCFAGGAVMFICRDEVELEAIRKKPVF